MHGQRGCAFRKGEGGCMTKVWAYVQERRQTEAGGTHPAGRHSCSVTSDIKAVYVVMIVFVNSVAC